VWGAEGDDTPTWYYGEVCSVHTPVGGGTDDVAEEVSVKWDADGTTQRLPASLLAEAEVIPMDPADVLLSKLVDSRSDELELAVGGGFDSVALNLATVKEELEAMRWMTKEVADRAEELRRLEEENSELLRERERYRAEYEAAVDESEAMDLAGEYERRMKQKRGG